MTQANKERVRLMIEELWGKRRTELIPTLFAPHAIDHMPIPGQEPSFAGLVEVVNVFDRAMPDFRMTLHLLVAEDDLVVDHWSFEGTHTGELFGIEPTGARVVMKGMDITRHRDDRIVEMWHVEDYVTMLAQLGRPTPLTAS